jgi:NAD(P)-dependent dehydrogenase (short-subunit alcohol dehydrogenase family)
MNDTKALANKTVVVLGGSAGIGLATAKAAAADGASVIIASSNQQRIDKALEQLPQGSKGFAVDLSSEENIKYFFDKTGPFDHLVYTAGENLEVADLDKLDLSKARQFFNLRYWSALAAVKYGSAKLNAGGSVTLTSGSGGFRPMKGWVIPASICTMMEGLTRALAVELAPLRVNCVMPGFVKTDLWGNIPEEHREAMFQSAAESLPVKHVATPEEIAQTYLYLIKQTYSTGQCVVVDGGGILA